MNIQSLIENSINEIWQEFGSEEFCEFSPLSVTKDADSRLVFVGLNPSLPNSEKERLENEKNKKCQFYTLRENKKEECSYFSKFYDVAEEVGVDKWEYLDLFYYRETESDKIDKLLKTTRGTDFFYKQAMVTKRIFDLLIDEKNPKIFVITSALTRNLLGKTRKKSELKYKGDWWLNFDFVWNDDWGTYECQGQPFFFTGMLSRGVLDNGSFERLIWQIKKVWEKIQ